MVKIDTLFISLRDKDGSILNLPLFDPPSIWRCGDLEPINDRKIG